MLAADRHLVLDQCCTVPVSARSVDLCSWAALSCQSCTCAKLVHTSVQGNLYHIEHAA